MQPRLHFRTINRYRDVDCDRRPHGSGWLAKVRELLAQADAALTASEVAEQLGARRRDVHNAITALRHSGHVVKVPAAPMRYRWRRAAAA